LDQASEWLFELHLGFLCNRWFFCFFADKNKQAGITGITGRDKRKIGDYSPFKAEEPLWA